MKKIFLLFKVFLYTACIPVSAQLGKQDFSLPILLDYYLEAPGKTVLIFNEPVTIEGEILSSCDSTCVYGYSRSERIELEYTSDNRNDEVFRLCVCDNAKNSYELFLPVPYWPENQAELIINEVVSKGSSKKPDFIELKVLEEGTLQACLIKGGCRNHFSFSISLPALDVKKKEFVIIDFDKTSAGKPAIKETFGWRIFPQTEEAISGNNGIITLYKNEKSKIPADCLLYSNRQDKDTENKNGWTSTIYPAICELESFGIWPYSGEFLTPSDAVDSSSATATRSFNRKKMTPEKTSWYICKSSNRSPGKENDP